MAHIDSVAHATHVDRHTGDITVANGINRLPLLLLRLDIQSAMKMVGTWLTKIACQ